jgi:hypothetical protein
MFHSGEAGYGAATQAAVSVEVTAAEWTGRRWLFGDCLLNLICVPYPEKEEALYMIWGVERRINGSAPPLARACRR